MFNRRDVIMFSSVILIIFVIIGGFGWYYRPHIFNGLVMQSAEPAPNFTLPATTGETVSLRSFQGQVVLLYFGYTFCPDVCPTTLADATKALNSLGSQSESVKVIFITVDPERDNIASMTDYVSHFHPNTIGLVPVTAEDTLTVATQYGIYYKKRDVGSNSGYLMDHTATLILIDQLGDIRAIYPFGTTPEDIAEDLAYVISRNQGGLYY
ncbi:SCO family protein [Anaerolineales bacterium HSG6]|nr:SCO family protein [Anaerolineales bacterium HSG6]